MPAMPQADFEKVTARLIMRPFRTHDDPMWRNTLLNLPEKPNIWDEGPSVTDDLTRPKFEALLEVER